MISYFYLKIKSRQKFNINALNFFKDFLNKEEPFEENFVGVDCTGEAKFGFDC